MLSSGLVTDGTDNWQFQLDITIRFIRFLSVIN